MVLVLKHAPWMTNSSGLHFVMKIDTSNNIKFLQFSKTSIKKIYEL